jgi:hypothetical protein
MAGNYFLDKYGPQSALPGPMVIAPRLPEDQLKPAQAATSLVNSQLETKSKQQAIEKDALDLQLKKEQFDLAHMKPTSDVTGDAYIKTLPAGMQNMVRGVLAGNVNLGQRPMASPTGVAVLQAALNADPSFNMADYNLRYQTKNDAVNGKMGFNVNALNTALSHSGLVLDDVNAMDNSKAVGGIGGIIGRNIYNPIKNLYSRLSGDPSVTNFNALAPVMGGEYGKAFASGGGGTGSEREAFGSSVGQNDSMPQQYGVLDQYAKATQGKFAALDSQYQRGMGPNAHISDLISPDAKAAYDRLMALTKPGAQTNGNQNQPPIVGGMMPGANGGSGGGGMNGSSSLQAQPGGGGGAPLAPTTASFTRQPDPAMSAYLDRMIRSGASAEQINAGLPSGTDPVDPAQVKAAQQYLQSDAGKAYKGSIGNATRSVPQTLLQRVAASGPMTALNGAVRGATGGLSMLPAAALTSATTGQSLGNAMIGNEARFEGANTANGGVGTAGEVAGGIGGMMMGGAALGASRFAPMIAANPRLAALAGDIGYGSTYGATTNPESPLTGAGIGALSSLGGNIAGRGISHFAGGALGGIRNDAVDFLRNKNIPLTVGDTVGGSGPVGRTVKGMESVLSSIPGVGSMVKGRQRDEFKALNLGAMNDVAGGVTDTGAPGAEQMQNAVMGQGGLYDQALAGKQVRIDPTYMQNMPQLQASILNIPRVGPELHAGLDTAITPMIGQGGTLSGTDFKSVLRGIEQVKAGHSDDPLFASHIAPAADAVKDQLSGLFARQSPDVIPALNIADTAYGKMKTVQAAQKAAKNQPDGIFAPSQLNTADYNNTVKFGGANQAATTDRPFYDLATNAQNVMGDRIPDSGTFTRQAGAHALGLSGLTGIGGGLGYELGGDAGSAKSGAEDGMMTAGVLALLGTKRGQQMLVSGLLDRPDVMKNVGGYIVNNAKTGGMLGRAVAPPLFLQSGQ